MAVNEQLLPTVVAKGAIEFLDRVSETVNLRRIDYPQFTNVTKQPISQRRHDTVYRNMLVL